VDLVEGSSPPYQAAQGLLKVAEVYWAEVDGSLAGQGVDPFDLSPRQFLNYVYTWALERIAPENREQWIADLNAVPVSEPDNVPQVVVDEEMTLFQQAQGTLR
jgi:hypothetical protein